MPPFNPAVAKVRAFRLLTKSDPCDDTPNWSRRYEWRYCLDELRTAPHLKRIHNTCCGPEAIHKIFHDALNTLGREITNSDIISTPVNQHFSRFRIYNLLDPAPEQFDAVLCVSTLEEMGSEDQIRQAFENLWGQVVEGGRLIMTFDHPKVRIGLFEEMLGIPCGREGRILCGSNSSYLDPRFSHLNIVLLDLEKVHGA